MVGSNDKQNVWSDFTPGQGRQHSSFEDKNLILTELGIFGWLRFTKAFDQELEADCHKDE